MRPVSIDSSWKPIDTYRRWLTYYRIEKKMAGAGIIDKYLEDPVLQCRRDWKSKFKGTLHCSTSYKMRDFKDLQIDFENLEKEKRKGRNHPSNN